MKFKILIKKINSFLEKKPIKKHKHYWILRGSSYTDESWWECKICEILKEEYEINNL